MKGLKKILKGQKKKQGREKKTTMELTAEEKQILLSMRKQKEQPKKEQEQQKKKVKGCLMVACENPITGEVEFYPVKCPVGYRETLRSKMREKGALFSPEPWGDDVELEIPEEDL